MKGARPLTNNEILLVAQQFSGTFPIRNRSPFMLGVSVGRRISELLALTVGDVPFCGKKALPNRRSQFIPITQAGLIANTPSQKGQYHNGIL